MEVMPATFASRNRLPIKAVLFDLDGTLLDSFSVHYAAYEAMFGHFGIEVSKELFLKSYSPNWYKTYEAFGLAEKHWDAANSIWLEAAGRHLPELFPGVRDLLTNLGATYSLGIVTSGSKTRVTKDIDRLRIAAHFAAVVTGDDTSEPKPSPEGLKIALSKLQIFPDDVIYVGDAHADFEMAVAAGVRFVGVPSEFANLSAGIPEYEIHPIASLADVIRVRYARSAIIGDR